MQRIEALNPETTTGKSKELFDGVQKKLGMVPNLMRTMGVSPAVLGGYLALSDALSKSSVGGKLSELIALTVANVNGCDYCNAAHSFIGEKLAGIQPAEIKAAREGRSANAKEEAALTFAKKVVQARGHVSDQDVQEVKDAGYSEAQVAEIIALTSLNILTNYFNNVALVEVDFPKVELAEVAAV
ncbi:carboxymuconolactone decarboxylase family protein [Fulvivirga ligni]|uniref:carboxymuconolactone decarboxylase family protein n=1 Tax=Fulvivirga ligni TaxID=2904246 RepID=UPI001F45A6B8|nr:carboxymuconolactone decarboxylase family protein [Fulvivirga ligni]UII20307.1 carboxymuconolactone decarboxylase family protein [Fulvivirga ligni]